MTAHIHAKTTPFKLLKQLDPGAAKWIKENGFKKGLNKSKDLSCLFDFCETCNDDSFAYWWDLHEKLRKAIKEHGI